METVKHIVFKMLKCVQVNLCFAAKRGLDYTKQ